MSKHVLTQLPKCKGSSLMLLRTILRYLSATAKTEAYHVECFNLLVGYN